MMTNHHPHQWQKEWRKVILFNVLRRFWFVLVVSVGTDLFVTLWSINDESNRLAYQTIGWSLWFLRATLWPAKHNILCTGTVSSIGRFIMIIITLLYCSSVQQAVKYQKSNFVSTLHYCSLQKEILNIYNMYILMINKNFDSSPGTTPIEIIENMASRWRKMRCRRHNGPFQGPITSK